MRSIFLLVTCRTACDVAVPDVRALHQAIVPGDSAIVFCGRDAIGPLSQVWSQPSFVETAEGDLGVDSMVSYADRSIRPGCFDVVNVVGDSATADRFAELLAERFPTPISRLRISELSR